MISVIIPVYNHYKHIQNCIDSIKNQTYKDFEIIVVNDGSIDNTEKAYEDLIKKNTDINIKYLSHGENRRAPAARNTGFRESKGEYLLFCDADSILEKNMFEALLDALNKNPKKSYAYSSFMWGRKMFKVGEWSREKLISGPCIHTMALIRRKDFPISGWDESIKKLQDWDLFLNMLKNNKQGIWINEVLFSIKAKGVYSNWLPSFAYRLMPFLPSVKRYKKAVSFIKKKYSLQ
jgi:glycosyltransferase involved in cell wall biosynthesis